MIKSSRLREAISRDPRHCENSRTMLRRIADSATDRRRQKGAHAK
jgi:hypothetical protein